MDPRDFRPDWAIGKASGYMEVGAQLPTRDGRRVGNAVVLFLETRDIGGETLELAQAITDAGTEITFTLAELEGQFHPPTWVMKPEDAPGLRKYPGMMNLFGGKLFDKEPNL